MRALLFPTIAIVGGLAYIACTDAGPLTSPSEDPALQLNLNNNAGNGNNNGGCRAGFMPVKAPQVGRRPDRNRDGIVCEKSRIDYVNNRGDRCPKNFFLVTWPAGFKPDKDRDGHICIGVRRTRIDNDGNGRDDRPTKDGQSRQ